MRDYIPTSYDILPTELGTFLVWSNGLRTLEDGRQVDVIGYRTEHEHNVRYGMGNLTREACAALSDHVTINRVDWRAHGVADLDPTTGELVERNDYARSSDILNRSDWKPENYESTRKATAKLLPIIRAALTTWAQSDDGRAVIRQARAAAANNDLRDVEASLAKLETERAELEARAAAHAAILEAHADALPAPREARNPFHARGRQA